VAPFHLFNQVNRDRLRQRRKRRFRDLCTFWKKNATRVEIRWANDGQLPSNVLGSRFVAARQIFFMDDEVQESQAGVLPIGVDGRSVALEEPIASRFDCERAKRISIETA
jgi:hypothetical protein